MSARPHKSGTQYRTLNRASALTTLIVIAAVIGCGLAWVSFHSGTRPGVHRP